MKILLIGRNGQVATAFQNIAAAEGLELIVLGRAEADLLQPEAAAKAVADHIAGVDAVVNTAAWTAVDRAEAEIEAARAVNATTPGAIARVAAAAGVPFVHISTDYVFDGSGDAPWKPSDPTGPLGAYGQTKLEGEEAIRAAGGPHAILRTSWVFSETGANFVKTMLRLSETRDKLTVVADQVGGPTAADAIASACLVLARGLVAGKPSETLHFSGFPDVSWADFAREIFARAGRHVSVEDIPTSAYPTPARRPENSRMDCSALANWGIERPDWRKGLDDVLAKLS
ncbi:dTDP-4-dehydrorhamnose reductase [Frigidibacter sp.]|uniref:dTDP-4-dehydrorhamnose reductase n=1 Tax=Frigidibacter sp. TaxID=2586418 RepID=UPI0027374830|nr:dTDP-4-dehydrorhamnose reductase [Frigidibacter sp.]MDP3342377.1 dTDP-4-dehydrorhamnose reductase [Frigidibacter sp.]